MVMMLVMVMVVVMVMRMTTKDEAVQHDWPAMPLVMEYGRMTHRQCNALNTQRNALKTQCVIDTHTEHDERGHRQSRDCRQKLRDQSSEG